MFLLLCHQFLGSWCTWARADMILLHSHTSVAASKGCLKLESALGNHIQITSMKCARLAPVQIQPPHADSWKIISALQTPALAASDQIQANLLYTCYACDLLGVPQVPFPKECKQPWPGQCYPVGEAEGGLIRAHLC